MKTTLAVLLLVFAAVSSGYQLDTDGYDPFEPFIAGGTNAALGQFPSVVAVGVPAPPNNAFCGGVILNANHVLTSARCMLTPTNVLHFPNQVGILAGQLQLNFAAARIPVSAIYVHPSFNPFTYENNIAVLRVAQPFFPPEVAIPNIGFAQLATDIPFDGEQCQVAGWNNATASPIQQFINVPILNRDTCNGLAVHLLRVAESMVCAGITTAGPGVCASNMGTPMFCNGRVAGILASGFGCGQANNPGVYTQIRFHQNWIQQQFQRQDIPAGGTSPIPIW